MLKLDLSQLAGFLPQGYAVSRQTGLKKAADMLAAGNGPGGDFTGWVALPEQYDREEFARIQAAAERIRSDSQALVVIGIGGSYLGARAVVELLHSPNFNLTHKGGPDIYFAGQITGFEGYMESAASGLLAAHQMLARLKDRELPPPPAATMCGALLDYITTPHKDFQPMGANMGILPRTEEINIIRDKRERYMALSQAAQDAMQAWVKEFEA